jgi:hypothetical protein
VPFSTPAHLAIATDDPDGTAQFYIDAFEFVRVRTASGVWGRGHILSDGTINLAILQFSTNEAVNRPGFDDRSVYWAAAS